MIKTDLKRLYNFTKFIAYVLPVLVMTGCASLPYSAQNLEIQPKDTFFLKQALEIAPNSARVYIQQGESNTSGFDHSAQHCRVEISNLSEHKQIIKPEHFIIESVSVDEEAIAKIHRKATQLAFNLANNTQTDFPVFIGYLGLGNQELPETMDLIHIYLKSTKQPNVYRLTCAGALSNGNPMDAPRSYRPDLKAINHILGSVGEIRIYR
ncbi:hypothetical protein [Thiomicrorhabdus sp. Milos-T2]|uniref:hypothetical protein n=1 Tax=Thiomicrorhabdus sp. Milos-T2 TaxID=90814 RepID=UPI000493E061|nr:hypothetical protein [Thiomicrorhabdus sp. Milos-T2]